MSTESIQKYDIEKGYRAALNLAKSHYENFPVVSFLVPKKLQKHIAIIYWFARTADDIADEGNMSPEERIRKLIDFENRLKNILSGVFESDYDAALSNTIIEKQISPINLFNLLKAFKQDVTKKRYNDFEEVLGYCKNSANPVGRLILELYNIKNEEAFIYSDKICTALQLTNFIQDIKIDLEKDRIYIPLDELKKYFVSEESFYQKKYNNNFKKLLKYNVKRIEELFIEGRKLLPFLKGRLKLEIKWTIFGGEKILAKIKKSNYNVFDKRPTLSKMDLLFLLYKTMI